MKKILDIWNKIADFARRGWAIAMHRPKALFLVGIILGSFLGHSISVMMTEARYRLSNGSIQLIGEVNLSLADKLKLDKNAGAYRFNADAITPEMTGESDPAKVAALLASQKRQTGGGGKETQNLYSLDLPIDPSQGTKIYDINSKTSFKLIPEFEMGLGRTEQGRVVYPLDEGGQAVYTVKANGIKEDIVLQKPRGDKLDFKYKLELPKTLEARLDDRGNLGIYSVDPMVSSAIAGTLQNGASSADTERLKDVQENGTKNHLVYLIPAPTIVQSGDQPQGHSAKAMYKLKGNELTVEVMGLEKLVYPISIDPTVVVTSTSDFAMGNDEGNISFDTDAISRASVTAGTTGAWSGTSSMVNSRSGHTLTAYNGYLYAIGGGGTALRSIEYAPINTDGTIGAWTSLVDLPANAYDHAAVAYNGYLYLVAGYLYSTSVRYAAINADGTLGSWATTSSLSTGRQSLESVAYNGYMYAISGATSSSSYAATIEYAAINADGTLGSWATTTGLATGLERFSAVVYNGYLYITGGYNSGVWFDGVQYVSINSDGTLGVWSTTTNLPTSYMDHASFITGGYLYLISGHNSSVLYAPVNADGTIGSWATTTSRGATRSGLAATTYKGSLYVSGGVVSGAASNTAEYAKVNPVPDPIFSMSSWSPTTVLGAGNGSQTAKVVSRWKHTAVTHDGNVFLIGGQSNTTPTATVHSAPINDNGTIGAWTVSANPLPQARDSHIAVVVNGYVYIIGGMVSGSASNTVLYSQLFHDGTNSTWTTTTPSGIASSGNAVTAYNGYLYVTGGTGSLATVHYSLIGTNGAPGAWTSTTALPVGLSDHVSVAYNGYIYAFGGATSGSTNSTVYYAPINANGTIGSWSTTTSHGNAFTGVVASVHEGHIVVNATADVNNDAVINYVKINSNGTLGTWSVSSMVHTPARVGHGSVIYNGYIYTIGGRANGTTYGDTLYSQISYTRTGYSAVGSTAVWQSAAATNLAIYGQASVVYNGYVYLVGGYGGGVYRNDVRYAPLNANGTIGSWTTSPNSVPTHSRFNCAAVAYNGYLYVTGGQHDTTYFSNNTAYAPINADGSLGSFSTSTNTFSNARSGHISVAYNGKLYVIAGGDGSSFYNDVQYATINANGSLGTWSSTTKYPSASRDGDGFIYGGRIYVIGGLAGTLYSNMVRHAPINTDGTLGSWVTSPYQFSGARSRHAVAVINGHIYLSGGGAASPYGDLQYAQINADGTIGIWRTGNNLTAVSGAPAGYYYHSMIAHKGRLYSFAGIEGTGTAQTASYVTGVKAPYLGALYSDVINLTAGSTLNSITVNGTLPLDQSSVFFKVAGANGIYGSWQPISVLSGAPISNVSSVMYKIVMNDSTYAPMFETTGKSTITDVTVDYTLPVVLLTPENRLRQNKYFDSSGVLQPLQTQ